MVVGSQHACDWLRAGAHARGVRDCACGAYSLVCVRARLLDGRYAEHVCKAMRATVEQVLAEAPTLAADTKAAARERFVPYGHEGDAAAAATAERPHRGAGSAVPAFVDIVSAAGVDCFGVAAKDCQVELRKVGAWVGESLGR